MGEMLSIYVELLARQFLSGYILPRRTGFFGNPLSFTDALREMQEKFTDNLKGKFSSYCSKVDHKEL